MIQLPCFVNRGAAEVESSVGIGFGKEKDLREVLLGVVGSARYCAREAIWIYMNFGVL
ncbi:hypothetical protein [Pseudomonas sp. BGI-2]|uniref:hypothetical protein n=1 Tax=Pseudomonas sp. BGI-2 TaxID=2528211 RepID=UPI0013F3AE95|nr:hypothetical protein [Pseudomonas sp. BGI-2]